MSQNNIEYEKKLPQKFGKTAYLLFGIGLVLVVLAFFIDTTRATYNSLLIFTFLFGLGLCSLFLVALEYVAGAVWSVPFRRISEMLTPLIFIAPIFAIPVLFNMGSVFHWAHHNIMETDQILASKSAYLNTTFFIVRLIVYILLMLIFYYVIIGNSKKQDFNPDPKYTRINIKFSAAFIPVFALTITFASIDWVMSLEPHWFSTMFGVYFFSGSLLTAFAALTFFAVKFKEYGLLPKELQSDHYYNLGAYLFAFINFWAYIAFSQFLLIWYANLPEETSWFLDKTNGSWLYVSIGLIFVMFLIPYTALLSQPSKSNYKRLKIMSLWILFAHFYDLYWMIMPNYHTESAFFGWIEIAFIIFAVGIVLSLMFLMNKRKNIIPINDPKLKRGLDFHL